jgi:hypothetical protein
LDDASTSIRIITISLDEPQEGIAELESSLAEAKARKLRLLREQTSSD